MILFSSTKCKNAAPEIMKTLEAGFDANKTCAAAGLCDDFGNFVSYK